MESLSLRVLFGFAAAAWLALAGCGVIQVKTAGAPSTGGADGEASEDEGGKPVAKVDDPKVKIDDLALRVKQARAKLDAEPAAATLELAKVRGELFARKTALEDAYAERHQEKREPGDGPEDFFFSARSRALAGYQPLTESGALVLDETFAYRAAVWARQGRPVDALRELLMADLLRDTVGMPPTDVPTLNCALAKGPGNAETKSACEAARKVVQEKWPTLCWSAQTPNACRLSNEAMLLFPESKQPMLTYATVTKATTNASGTEVVTMDMDPRDVELCKGEFQTDKILDINERRILIERTTWCKSIAKERRTGYRVTHRLGKTPVPLKRGDRLLLLVEPKNVKLGRAGEIELVTATSTLLAAMAGASSVYQWNEVTPAK